MRETIYICDVCGESDATSIRLRPLSIGHFDIDGVFMPFPTPPHSRFHEIQVELCERCAAKTETVPLVAYGRSNGTRAVMFNEEGARPIDYPKLSNLD